MNIMDYVIAIICILLTFGGMIWYVILSRKGSSDKPSEKTEKKAGKQ